MTTDADDRAPAADETLSRLTVANGLCVIRLLGSPVLLWLAWRDEHTAFVVLLIFLQLTDMVDGRIARWLHQRSTFGARLDTVADVLLYTTLVPSFWLLKPAVVQSQFWFILAAGLSYGMSVSASLSRFGRPPSYHNRLAKMSWGLISLGVVVALLDGPIWPLQIALACVILTNIEATLISFVLPAWRPDVPSVYHAWREASHRK